MDTNALNEIADLSRVLATIAPEAGQNLRKALDSLAECRNEATLQKYVATERHNVNCYREQCDEARAELHKLAVLVYRHLPDFTLQFCRINPMWRMDAKETDWPSIVAELKTIEDAALRKLLAAGGKRKVTRRRRKSDNMPKPLTAKQLEAVQIVGECKGNITKAAEQVGIDRKSMQERYDAAMTKLGASAVKHKTKQLGNDKRGQANIVGGDDRRG